MSGKNVVIIDGPNVFYGMMPSMKEPPPGYKRRLKFHILFEKIIHQYGRIDQIIYVDTRNAGDPKMKDFYSYLDKLAIEGYPIKKILPLNGETVETGWDDMQIKRYLQDIHEGKVIQNVLNICLFAGDEHYCKHLETLYSAGKKIHIHSVPRMTSDRLYQFSSFSNLLDFEDEILYFIPDFTNGHKIENPLSTDEVVVSISLPADQLEKAKEIVDYNNSFISTMKIKGHRVEMYKRSKVY